MKIYLAGYISGTKIKECTDWRMQVRNHYASMGWDIEFLDPLNGKELGTITPDGLKCAVPGSALFHRDYMAVSNSDLIVANLNRYGEDRVPVGTISELAWAWTMHKPIVLITTESQYLHHPFMTQFVSWFVPDVETLLKEKIINYMYKGINGAVYTKEEVSPLSATSLDANK
jgi:hypothetical protein